MGTTFRALATIMQSRSLLLLATIGIFADDVAATLEPKAKAAAADVATAIAAGNKEVTIKHDHTTREGNGDNLPYKGIDYLGMGYDLLKGNPHGDPDSMLDPGFRIPAVELTWSQDNAHLSRDVRDLQPIEGWAYPETACRRASSSKQQSTMSEYEESLSAEASVSAGGGGYGVEASFEASAGYDSFESEVASTDSERFEMTSFCYTSTAGLRTGDAADLKPTAYFAKMASKLPKMRRSKCHRDFRRCIHLTNRGKTLTVKALDNKLPEGVESNESLPEFEIKAVPTNRRQGTPDEAHFSWGPKWHTLMHYSTGEVLGVVEDANEKLGYRLTLKSDYHDLKSVQSKEGSEALKAEDKWDYDDSAGLFYVTVPKASASGSGSGSGSAAFLETENKKFFGFFKALKRAKELAAKKAAAIKAAAAAAAKKRLQKPPPPPPIPMTRLALKIGKDGKVGLWRWAKKAEKAVEINEGSKITINRIPEDNYNRWAVLFQEFGTHFINTLHLGGKMIYTCDLTSESVEKIEQSGVSASMAVEASYEGFGASASAGASASMSQSQKAANAMSKVEKTEKTIVIGGKPSESDPADPAAFGEWAATVEDNPMPIKYSLRPLSALGTKDSPTKDFETYNLMLELYESGLLRAKREKNAADELEKGSSTLEPGEEITSGMKLKDHVAKVVFEIKPNGLMTLTDKFNNKLWTSGVTRSDSDGPFRLAYQMDGDLVLYSKDGSRVWASNTKYGNCGSRNPGMVRITKGSLEILPESTKEGPIWSTKSTNSNGAPTKADDQYWTCGWNRCQEKCVRHCQHAGYGGTCHEKGPGNHDIGSLGGNDQLSSIEVKNGCVAELFQHAHFTGRKWTFAHSAHYVGNGVNDQTSSMRIKSCPF